MQKIWAYLAAITLLGVFAYIKANIINAHLAFEQIKKVPPKSKLLEETFSFDIKFVSNRLS
jgi:hypothetical protein